MPPASPSSPTARSPIATSPGAVIVPLPPGATVKVTGFVNSGGWAQQIIVGVVGSSPATWTGTGVQDNHVVGQITLAQAKTPGTQLKIQMQYNPGNGYQPSDVRAW